MSAAARAGLLERAWQLPGLPAAAFLAGLLFVFQPAQVYQANAVYFTFLTEWSFARLLFLLVPAFLVAFAVLASLAAIGGGRGRRVAAVVLSALALAMWASATFFTASKGLIDGRALLQLAEARQVWINAALFLALLGAGGAAAWFRPEWTRRFFAALFVLLLAQSAWIAASESKPAAGASHPQRFATLSSERNVLVLLLDAFQSDFFTQILAQDARLAEALPGFTFFPNTVGPSTTTYLAMPVIHAGHHVGEGESLARAYEVAVERESFVAKLAAKGYDAVMVNAMLGRCPTGAACANAYHLVHGDDPVALDSAAFLVNLALFRAAPHALKGAVYNRGKWRLPHGFIAKAGLTSNELLDQLAARVAGGAGKPTVRFLHIFSTHAPVIVDAQCRPIAGGTWTRGPALEQDRCALSKVSALLAALQRQNLYDQTAIVILADHGAGLPAEGSAFRLAADASPLLLVKPFGARAPLKVSERVVGLGDVPATICAMTAACAFANGSNVLAEAPARAPAYPHVSYTWRGGFEQDSIPIDNRFEVRGPQRSVSSWWRLTNLPRQPIRSLDFAKSDPPGHYGLGWSEFETYETRTLRWAVGPEADIYLELDPARDAKLTFEAWTHPANAGQKFTVEVNGAAVGEVAVGLGPARHELVIPARFLGAGAERILFRFSKHEPPGPADVRRLAVLFDQIVVQQ